MTHWAFKYHVIVGKASVSVLRERKCESIQKVIYQDVGVEL